MQWISYWLKENVGVARVAPYLLERQWKEGRKERGMEKGERKQLWEKDEFLLLILMEVKKLLFLAYSLIFKDTVKS